MRLRKLTLINFRQFKGEQTMEFAANPDANEVVTVVHGANGRGKTGLFRAVMFCLYGDARLLQDGDLGEDDLLLANESAVRASSGQPITVSVELVFSHKSDDYRLKRSLLAMHGNGKVLIQQHDLELALTRDDGNTEYIQPREVAAVVNNVMDKRVRDYFLVDGERIERLTRATNEERREIGKAIRNLLDIDVLENAIKALGRLVSELQESLENNTTGDLQKLLFQRRKIEEEQNDILHTIEGKKDELARANDEHDDVESKLQDFKEIRDLVLERENLKARRVELEDQRKNELASMVSKCGLAAALMISKPIEDVFRQIDVQRKQGELPSKIRKDLIERILADACCICGRNVSEGSTEYGEITEWLNSAKDSAVEDMALDLWSHLGEVRSHFRPTAKDVERILFQYGSISNDIHKIDESLERISKLIGENERRDVAGLEKSRKELVKGIAKLELEIDKLILQLNALKDDFSKTEYKIIEEQRKNRQQVELSKRLDLARGTKSALDEVRRSFIEEKKVQVSQYTTEIFRRLIDKEGRNVLKEVIVENDYSLQILDQYGNLFLANISAGQRQVMSIAFVAALAQAACGSSLEIPLFMDTPFGRLSFEHRKNLLMELPRLFSQWILLATDTEFGSKESDLLRGGGMWKKFYSLEASLDGNTKIIERKVDNASLIVSRGLD